MARSGIRSRGVLRQLPRFCRRSEELRRLRAAQSTVCRQRLFVGIISSTSSSVSFSMSFMTDGTA